MDTLTMINEAINNPEQQYETDCGKVHYKDGTLKWVDSGCTFAIGSRSLQFKWKKAPEPVDFMTAIKAYNDGKTIICKIHNNEFSYNKNNLGYGGLIDKTGASINVLEILEGEWYIED